MGRQKKYFTEEERKEARREYDKRYYEKHPEAITRWAKMHPEEMREHRRLWEERHPEKKKESVKKYREMHPEKVKANSLSQGYKRSDKLHNRGECTLTQQWIVDNILSKSCYYCGETDWRVLGCDRINNDLPHTPDNVVPCCRSCNRKRHKMPFDEFVQKCKEAGEIVTYRNRPDYSKPCFALDAEGKGNVVYEFPSAMEAQRNGFRQSAVSQCCKGCFNHPGNHKYKGLWWYYKE